MQMVVLITKGDEILYNKSVTADTIPSELIQLFNLVHGCKLVITRD